MMMVIKNPSLATTALVLQIVLPSLRQLRCFIVMDHVVMTGWIMYTDVNKLTLMLIANLNIVMTVLLRSLMNRPWHSMLLVSRAIIMVKISVIGLECKVFISARMYVQITEQEVLWQMSFALVIINL